MAVARINRAIAGLHLDNVMQVPEGMSIRVCDASAAEWDAFVESEDQVLKSTHMEWVDGSIIIVELATPEHEVYISRFHRNFLHDDVVYANMQGYGAAFFRTARPKLEADLSYGPLHAPLPAGLNHYRDWHTLKVEVGFSRRWGYAAGQLDWKANRWATFVGVRYILCIAVWRNLARAEYKLYTVGRLGVALPEQQPIPVQAPHTVVTFNSRVLLGLHPRGALPGGFPDPLPLDLYQILVEARRAWP